jgi:hypothetical protein
MTKWQPPKREPAETKVELREMLAEAVRNTQAENKRLQQAKRVKAAELGATRYALLPAKKMDRLDLFVVLSLGRGL